MGEVIQFGRPDAIICDLDGTLCNNLHRLDNLYPPPHMERNWVQFYDKMDEDEPNEWCVKLIKSMDKSLYRIIFLTGRPETYREKTEKWIEKFVGFDRLRYLLYMRPERNYVQDAVYKVEVYKREILPNYHVLFAIEDRSRCVEALRQSGVTVLQCCKGDY